MDKQVNLCGIENCKYNKNKICCLTRDPSVCFTNLCEIAKRDKQISDLEAKLAESEAESNARYSALQEEIGECDRLRVVLAEEREKLERKERIICAFEMVQKENEEFAIEKLEEIKELVEKYFNLDKCNLALAIVLDKIDNQIKMLKENK